MKKLFTLVLIVFCSQLAFSQVKGIDYVEKGVTEKGETYVLTAVTKDGDTVFVELNKRNFHNRTNSDVSKTAYSLEELPNIIANWKQKGYAIKEMYEQNDVYHILFTPRIEE